jgi:hypothetical protein
MVRAVERSCAKGISVDTVKARLKKLSLKEALTRPLRAGRAWSR